MRKFLVLIISAFLCVSFSGCAAAGSNSFTEAKAISMAMQSHKDFPSNQSTVTKRLPTGGPQGATAAVKFTTKAEKSSGNSYIVTFTKDWQTSVNGKKAVSTFKYKVAPGSVTLLQNDDNDNIVKTMK